LLEDFEALVKEFEKSFGDADKSRTATNKIQKLSKDLEQLQFRTGLHNEIKDLLLTLEDPILLNDAISKIDAVRFKPLSEEEKRFKLLSEGKKDDAVPIISVYIAVNQSTLLNITPRSIIGHQESYYSHHREIVKKRTTPAAVRRLRLDQEFNLLSKTSLVSLTTALTSEIIYMYLIGSK
ncbi:10271_t:CDS:2, partial [Dentiscutata heterogama]